MKEAAQLTSGTPNLVVRVSRACLECGRKKNRCSGEKPCAGCLRSGAQCDYPEARRRGPKRRKTSVEHEETSDQADGDSSSAAIIEDLTSIMIEEHLPSGGMSVARPPLPPVAQHISTPRVSSSRTTIACPPQLSPLANTIRSEDGANQARRLFPDEGPNLVGFSDLVQKLGGQASTSMGPIQASPSLFSDLNLSGPSGRASTTEMLVADLLSGFPSQRFESRPLHGASPSDMNVTPLNDAASGLLMAEPIDRALEEHLIKTYWTYVHPLWPIIYRPVFDLDMITKQHPALYYAMLAVTCVGTLDFPLLQRSELLAKGAGYVYKFQMYLDTKTFSPSIPTCQALMLVAIRETAQGHTQTGWQYLSMAIRMAIELGLHTLKSPGATTNAAKPRIKMQEHSRVIWGCYVVDKYFSVLLGRPMMLRIADISAPYPSHMESDEFTVWSSDAKGVLRADYLANFYGMFTETMSNFKSWTELAAILEGIIASLYPARRQTDSQRVSSLRELDGALTLWSESHPNRTGNFSEVLPPHLLYIKLWYQACRLIMHRPFSPAAIDFQRDDRKVTSYDICVDAADSIYHIFSTYDRFVGLESLSNAYVFILFQATIIYVAGSSALDPLVADRAEVKLQQCMRWMNTMAGSYAMTTNYISTLLSLKALCGRELKASEEVAAILASRMGSREGTPIPGPLAGLSDEVFNAINRDYPLPPLHDSFWGSMPLTWLDPAWGTFAAEYDDLLINNSIL